MKEKQGGYKKYLSTRHWKEIRKIAIQDRGKYCEFCNTDKNINIHHITYSDKNKESILWKETSHYLYPLCSRCHGLWHKYHNNTVLTKSIITRFNKLKNAKYSIDECIRFCTDRVLGRYMIKLGNADADGKIKMLYYQRLKDIYQKSFGITSPLPKSTHNLQAILLNEDKISKEEILRIKKQINSII
jgi:hypothetical protein